MEESKKKPDDTGALSKLGDKTQGEGSADMLIANGKHEDGGQSDNIAQVLKDIAILNGTSTEFDDDRINSFSGKTQSSGLIDKDLNTDSGINSVDSAGGESKVENGGDHGEEIPSGKDMDISQNGVSNGNGSNSEKSNGDIHEVVEIDEDPAESDSEPMGVDEPVVIVEKDESSNDSSKSVSGVADHSRSSEDSSDRSKDTDSVVVNDKGKSEETNDSDLSLKSLDASNMEVSVIDIEKEKL